MAEAAAAGPGGGAALLGRALRELSREDDLCSARPAQWDASQVELTPAVKTRIPPIVEERCKGARHRANCGLIPAARHAWASADALLHLWDYRREIPEVVVLPADSTVVTVAACPPRPGVFGAAVDLLLVVCTRTSVSLWGLQLPCAAAGPAAPAAAPPARQPAAAARAGAAAPPSAQSRPPPLGAAGQAAPLAPGGQAPLPGAGAPLLGGGAAGDSLRLIALEGYAARTDGVLFHCVAHTDDGHILLACGTPQIFELAYSRTPGWFHSKCRLVQHAMGLRSRMRDLLSFSAFTSGRIRLLACAPHDYVVAVDDASTIRLYGIRDHAVHRAESVAVMQELASLTVGELSEQLCARTKVHLASRNVTHVFPALGLDGHLRLHVVTAASERLLLLCSRTLPEAPRGRAGEEAGGPPRLQHGFWLQHATESPLGHGGSSTNSSGPLIPWTGGSTAFSSFLAGDAVGGSAGRRITCLEESREPCAYSSGVWVAASHRPGVAVTEVGISVRIGDYAEGSAVGGADGNCARSLYTSLTLDSTVLDITEEGDVTVANAAVGSRALLVNRALEGEPTAFRGNRSFALLLQHSVQVFHVNFKADTLGRPPATPAECCRHLVSLTAPSDTSAGQGAADLALQRTWGWTYDDVRVPRFEELRHCIDVGQAPPQASLGKWLSGLLRFLALVLRPVWSLPLVEPLKGQQPSAAELLRGRPGEALALSLDEAAVRRLLARLRPALRFARQGLAPLPADKANGGSVAAAVPASVAARSRLYSHGRAASSEGAAQAQRTLRGVLDVAERARQVLGLVSVLHSQKSAYRVLQSSVMAGPALESLMKEPLSNLVTSPEALAPAVQLCTALVVESGLATPSAGIVFDAKGFPQPLSASGAKPQEAPAIAADLCRDLEEQCPVIFAQVNLGYMQTRLMSQGGGSSGELLRRYAQCVSSASQEDQWTALAGGVRTMAAEDPRAAADLCAGKLQQLRSPDSAAGLRHARALLGALLEALALQPRARPQADPLRDTVTLVEHLLAKTASLKLGGPEEGAPVPAAHGIILDYLLNNKQMHKVLEALLGNSVTDVEAFLARRCGDNLFAGELLWKHHIQQGRPAEASEVLLQLAERTDTDCGLAERTHCLDLAHQAAGRGLPQTKASVEKLKAQLDVAARVQVPLQRELQLLAQDERVAPRWREAAGQRSRALERLLGLQALYEVVVEFGLYHLVLVIADLSCNVQEKEHISYAWVSVFFPPAVSPYSPSEMVGSEDLQRQHGLFPLLLARRSAAFLLQGESVPPLPVAASAHLQDLRLRASRLLGELGAATQAPSPVWDAHCVTVLLEFCNCLWHCSFELDDPQDLAGADTALAGPGAPADADAPAPSRARRAPGAEAPPAAPGGPAAGERAWIALSVLMQRPFHFTHLSVLRFYSQMLTELPVWLRDLQALLPPDPAHRRPDLTEDDLRTHLAEVSLIVLDCWASQAEAARAGDRAAAEFCSALPTVEGLLAGARGQLKAVRGKAQLAAAKRLLGEVDRLEASGRRLQDRSAASGAAGGLAGLAARASGPGG